MSRLISRLNKRFIYNYTPYLWPFISFLLNTISKRNTFLPPGSKNIDSAIILVHNLNVGDRLGDAWGLDLTDAVENWLVQTLDFRETIIVDSLDEISQDNPRTVLIVSYDWLFSGRRWKSFFKEIRQLAHDARKRKLQVWVMLADVYDQGSIIPASLLLSLCGGAMILQPNTVTEAARFGLVFPSGPHIWTMPPKNLKQFESQVAWVEREKVVLLPSGGEERRRVFMEKVADQMVSSGWEVQSTNKTFAWNEYVGVVKNCRILVTTCWLQQQFLVGSKKTRRRMPTSTVTHRVWEGFAAGCTVVTNSNAVLNELGFIAGVHYIELWNDETLDGSFHLQADFELEKIAAAGHLHFTKLVLG